MNANDTREPAEIEREIRETQMEMSRTVDTLGEQFTARSLFDALLDKADENNIDARYILDGARRNPVALGLIAAGGIWLLSENDAKLPKMSSSDDNSSGGSTSRYPGRTSSYTHHDGYIAHMSSVEPRADEDDLAYRRRRDHARASYMMIERGHDEDEGAFRKRLDSATDRMREQREKLAGQASAASSKTREMGSQAASKVGGAYRSNPLLGGLAAALVGAVAGSALPATRTEEEQFGALGAKALDQAKNQARQVGEQAREKKDQLVDKAESRMGEGNSSPSTSSASTTRLA